MWSHISNVKNGEVKYLREVSREECDRMHRHKSIYIADTSLNGLRINDSIMHPLTFAGAFKTDWSCSNTGHYADPYGEFYDVVVNGYVTIKLEERLNTVNLNNNKIRLESGTQCAFTDDHCIDMQFGYPFWDMVPTGPCEARKYSALYIGPVMKVTERGNERRPLYVLEAEDLSFAFKDIGLVNVCSYQLIRTEHPKLFILLDPAHERLIVDKRISISNTDILAYLNSQFVYVDAHIKGQMTRLYRDVIEKQCELEHKVLANSLSIATISPDLLSYQIMRAPGYISLLAGELVHVLKCVQVEVKVRPTEECYQELPVFWEEKPRFLSPRTHILREFGTKAICDSMIPVMFLIGERWFKMLPQITIQDTPSILKPQIQQTWTYTNPTDLANSGIYSYGDMDSLKNFIMFPHERGAILNTLAYGYSGKGKITGSGSIARLLDEDALSRKADSTWDRVWWRLITFGSKSAAFISILMIFRLIKFVLDTMIHGYVLYSLYGWSVHLIRALWNSLPHLLLHLGKDCDLEKPGERPPTAPSAAEAPFPCTTQKYHLECQWSENNAKNNPGIIENKLYPVLNEANNPALPPRNLV